MRRFVIWFALFAPLLLWISATAALVLTAPIWLNFPGCCLIDNSVLLWWLGILPLAYLTVVLPAAATALLIFRLSLWCDSFETSAVFVSLLMSLLGVFVLMIDITRRLGEDLFSRFSLILIGAVFGMLFTTIGLSAQVARRLSRGAL
jgi:hypothetical protein